GVGLGLLLRPAHAVVRLEDHEEQEAHDDERDDGVDDEADADAGVADVEPDAPVVGLAEDGGDDGVDHALQQRVDDVLEVQRHHEADGDRDEVALVEEPLELLPDLLHCATPTVLAEPRWHRQRPLKHGPSAGPGDGGYGANMRIGINGGATTTGTIDDVIAEARPAADDGFHTYWAPQIFGLDAPTAVSIAGKEGPAIRLG